MLGENAVESYRTSAVGYLFGRKQPTRLRTIILLVALVGIVAKLTAAVLAAD